MPLSLIILMVVGVASVVVISGYMLCIAILEYRYHEKVRNPYNILRHPFDVSKTLKQELPIPPKGFVWLTNIVNEPTPHLGDSGATQPCFTAMLSSGSREVSVSIPLFYSIHQNRYVPVTWEQMYLTSTSPWKVKQEFIADAKRQFGDALRRASF